MLESDFALELDRAEANPDAGHVGGYLAFGPEPRNAGGNRKRLQQ
jgi:hypothetical protein